MRVDRMKVELAGNQEDDCLDGGQAFVATSAALGCLEQPVDGFEKAIGLTRLCPGNDALEVTTYESGDLLHRLDLGAHHAGAPVLEGLAHHVDLLAIQGLAQLLL